MNNTSPSFISRFMLPDVSFCDKLIKHFEKSKKKQYPGMLYNTEMKERQIHGDKRSTDMHIIGKLREEYEINLQVCLEKYWKEFPDSDKTNSYSINEHINMQRYNPPDEGFVGWHTERGGVYNARRHLVFMTYLNTVKKGGETEYFYQKIKVKHKKGINLIWQVDWTHLHRGLPSPKETKYIITGWFSFNI